MPSHLKYLEPYQDRDSLIHHLDGRLKLLAALTFIIAVTAVPVEGWPALLLLAGLAGLAVIAAHISPLDLFKRSAAALPFAGMAVLSLPFTQPGRPIWSAAVWSLQWTITAQGLRLAAVLMVKVWLSVLIGGLLVATTPFTRLLQALELLRVPPVLVTIMSFMYRYLFVLVDEAMRLQTARQARSVGRGRTVRWRIEVLGHMIGSLFIRSYERSERIYAAMLSRGLSGPTRPLQRLHWQQCDGWAGLVWAAALIGITIWGQVIA